MVIDMPEDVAAVVADLSNDSRELLLRLRALILEVAEEVGAAPVQEVLRWNQPSYLSARPRESTAVRLAPTRDGKHVSLLVHCQSSVIPEFRARFPDDFHYDGNRAILFTPGDDLQADKLAECIAHALRYRA